MLCLDAEDMVKLLKPQLRIAHRSYIDLVDRLHKGLPMTRGIDFYMAAARHFIGEPVLLVKPTLNPKYGKEKGPRFLFEKHFLFKGDEKMNSADIKLNFVFNGIDYYAPFYQSTVAQIIRSGNITLKNVQTVAKDFQCLLERMPDEASLNVGFKQIALHLDAAAQTASKTRLTCGYAPIEDVTKIEIPGVVAPQIEGTIRRRKHYILDKSGNEPPKKKVADTDNAVNASEEVSPEVQGTGSDMDKRTSQPETAAETPDSLETPQDAAASPAKKSTLDPENRRKYTYMKDNQCVCGFEARSQDELKLHDGMQHPKKTYHCWGLVVDDTGSTSKCTYKTKDEGKMWRHYRTMHLGLYYNYCPVEDCHDGPNDGKYGADCEDGVRKHMVEAHGVSDAAKLICPNAGCNYVAAAKYLLGRHKKKCDEHDKKVKFYICDTCGKGFRSFDNCSRHKRQKHPVNPTDDSAWYHCKHCTKKFASISSRRTHTKKKHTAELLAADEALEEAENESDEEESGASE